MNRTWVLIVEDEIEISEMMAQRLEKEDISSVTCQGEMEATVKLKNQDFACVILDLHLKQGSGQRTIEFISDHAKLKGVPIPIVLMSGNLDVDLIKDLRGKISGAFVKPFDPALLIAKVKSLIGA